MNILAWRDVVVSVLSYEWRHRHRGFVFNHIRHFSSKKIKTYQILQTALMSASHIYDIFWRTLQSFMLFFI